MKIESASFKVCIVDGLEPRKSAVYKRLRRLCGKKVANLMVQEVNIVFKPPDEVTPHVETTRNTPDPLGAAG